MLSPAEMLELKAQTRLSVKECGGAEACVDATTRITRSASFRDFGAIHLPEKFVSIDTAAELDRFCDNPRFAKLLANLAGGVFVPLPEGVGPGQIEAAAGKSASEFGDVMVVLGEALRDGNVDNVEVKKILREIMEAIAAMAGLAERVKAEVLRGGGAGGGSKASNGGDVNYSGGGAGQPVGARPNNDGGVNKGGYR